VQYQKFKVYYEDKLGRKRSRIVKAENKGHAMWFVARTGRKVLHVELIKKRGRKS